MVGGMLQGLEEQPRQTLGFQLSAPGSRFVYHGKNSCSFHPLVRSEGVWNFPVSGRKRPWRDGEMVPALNWKRECPGGRELWPHWLLAMTLGMLQASWAPPLYSVQLSGGGQDCTSTPSP